MSLRAVPALLVICAAALLPAAARAQTPATASPGTITAIGTSSVKPVPTDATDNASIAAAVRAARRTAIPRAIGDARQRALVLAAAGRLQLGALLGIADTTASPFFGGVYGQDGTFGPGRYCGLVNRYRTTRTKAGGIHRKLIGRSRRCRVPSSVTATEAVTFAATT